MNKKIVRYNNDLNSVTFGSFREKELDLFFSICFKLKELGTDEVEISFEELKELSDYSNRNVRRFINDLESTYDKMLGLNIKMKHSEMSFEKFNLFTAYSVDGDSKKIRIKVSEKFEYILNKILGNYTKFDLIDFVRLRSTYSKNLFKLLKQWNSVKEFKVSVEDFKELLGVSDKYTTANFNTRVLGPIMEELPQHFKGLTLEKIKTGRKVTHLRFTWQIEKQEILQKEKIEIQLTESLNSIFEKVRKNRFLQEWLTDKNIYKLTQMYDEQPLKKGLMYIYKEIKKEVPNFAYLIRVIESGIATQEFQVSVVKDEDLTKNDGVNEVENGIKKEIHPLLLAFEGMPSSIQEILLNQAKELYMKDVNIQKMNLTHEKFFKAAQKSYILKILGGKV